MTKNNRSCVLLGALVLAGAGSPALAERPADTLLQVGELAHGGSGCTQGTLRHAWSPDGRHLAIGFDGYVARAEPGDSFDRATCAIAVPVSMPAGFRISLSRLRVYGAADIPPDARGSFRAEYFLAGSLGSVLSEELSGDFAGSFVRESDVPVWSACGADGIIRVNSSALVRQRSAQRTSAVMELEYMTLRLEVERCGP